MNDLISRQDAIDLVIDMEFMNNTAKGILRGRLRKLPSAQPEQRWIPCSERLPEEGVSVLISVGGVYSAEGCLRWDKDWNQFRWSAIQDKEVVDAWMPLPEPFKRDRND